MALVEMNWKPDRKTLKEFSEIWLFFLGMIFAFLALRSGHTTVAYTLWIVAVAGRVIGMLRPEWLRYPFIGLMLLALPIGWVISHAALAIAYYLVLTPLGLIFRLMGRDAMQRTLDREATTYWEPHNPNQGLKRYLRQF